VEVAEHQRAVAPEPRPDIDLRRTTPNGLERLLEGQHEPDRPIRRECHEREQRFVLGVLLTAKGATRVRRVDANLGERQAQQVRDDSLQPVRMLDRAPDRDAVAVGRSHERVRLDRELGHHREVVRALDDCELGIGCCRIHVAPRVAVLVEDVAVRLRVVRPKPRILDEGRFRG
jgi:hypothetical protein